MLTLKQGIRAQKLPALISNMSALHKTRSARLSQVHTVGDDFNGLAVALHAMHEYASKEGAQEFEERRATT